jgi:hypothetical protein
MADFARLELAADSQVGRVRPGAPRLQRTTLMPKGVFRVRTVPGQTRFTSRRPSGKKK